MSPSKGHHRRQRHFFLRCTGHSGNKCRIAILHDQFLIGLQNYFFVGVVEERDLDRTMDEDGLRILFIGIGPDIQAGAQYPDIDGRSMNDKGMILVLCNIKICLSRELHVPVRSTEMLAIDEPAIGIQPYLRTIRQLDLRFGSPLRAYRILCALPDALFRRGL